MRIFILYLFSFMRHISLHQGYLVLSNLVNENSELIRLVNQTLLSDLTSGNEKSVCLALSFIANCGNAETAEILANQVGKLMMDTSSSSFIIKKSTLTLLHLFRKNPDAVQPDSWHDYI